MLLPQYSIRWLFGITTACAVVFAIFAFAMRGSPLASAISVAIACLVMMALVHVAMFALIWGVSRLMPKSPPPRQEQQASTDEGVATLELVEWK